MEMPCGAPGVSSDDPSHESDNDPSDDNKEGSKDSTLFQKAGIHIPYGDRKKNMTYILFHYDDTYRLLFPESCIHLPFYWGLPSLFHVMVNI